jgi:CBS domain-containing protein
MHDIAEFLGGRDPFSGLDEGELEGLAALTEVEFFAAGANIPDAEDRVELVRVIRRGAVELLERDRPIDRLEEGETLVPFSRRQGEGTISARAAEDTLTYAIPASEVAPLLGRRPGSAAIGGVSPSLASKLARTPTLALAPETAVRDAARAMDESSTSVALVGEPSRPLGILTDRDLRSRVVAGGLSADAPVSEAMSTPVISASPDASPPELAVTMLEHDIHHLPLVSGSEVIGIVESTDLLAPDSHGALHLRRAISRARDSAELQEAAAALQPTVLAMRRTGMTAARISEAISVVTDALVRRTIEVSTGEGDSADTEFAWLALGSHGRREPAPSSDLDSGMAWRVRAGAGDEETKRRMLGVAEGVEACLREIGWRLDPHGVTASGSFSASSIDEWRQAIEDWLNRPAADQVPLALAITLDSRVVQGPAELDPRRFLWQGRDRARLLRIMLRWAINLRPPTGFLGRIVVERGGEHSGTLDIKRGGISPVVDLARFAALEAGVEATSTDVRLDAVAGEGSLDHEQAQSLAHAHELFAELRLDHQCEQLQQGRKPDDRLDPERLDPLTRRYLRDAFREIDAIQGFLERQLGLGRGRI